jgi:D-serine deaminase-like pyridoxal phosphate-dependent protein
MTIDDLDTPALTIDLNILARNIETVATRCREHDIRLRVHTKTHKIPEIARMQLDAGAIGIASQKVGEAEAMVAGGIEDILIPYNIVGGRKVDRLATLCERARMTVAADSETTVQGLSEGLSAKGTSAGVLVECDTGGGRCGVQTPEGARDLARLIDKLPGLILEGVMTYPSHERAKPFLDEVRGLFFESGLPLNTISGGGTGSEATSKAIGCTEVRIGSYVFEGPTRINRNTNPPNPTTCAERMICTVVSTPTSERIIIDGGQKTFTSYAPTPYGYIVEHPDAKINGMSVEHGHVDVSNVDHVFQIGEKLSVIPLHQGMTTNLHDTVYAVRNGQVEATWTVAGRGRVQ